ncbi:MAG: hypothetical protein PWQ18_1045 [Clostridia bacterium]|nr:hypothetical protein [Clostridia bacterium]
MGGAQGYLDATMAGEWVDAAGSDLYEAGRRPVKLTGGGPVMKKYLNSRVLAIIIVLLIIGVIIQTVLLYEQMVGLADRYYRVGQESYVALYDLKNIEKLVIDMETGERGYLLTGDPAFLAPYNEAQQEIQDYYKKLAGNLGQDTASLGYLESINQKIQSWAERVAGPAIANRKLLGPDTTLKTLTASSGRPGC